MFPCFTLKPLKILTENGSVEFLLHVPKTKHFDQLLVLLSPLITIVIILKIISTTEILLAIQPSVASVLHPINLTPPLPLFESVRAALSYIILFRDIWAFCSRRVNCRRRFPNREEDLLKVDTFRGVPTVALELFIRRPVTLPPKGRNRSSFVI